MESKDRYCCPPHYVRIAMEIADMNRLIRHGLSHRPIPGGVAWQVPEQASSLLEDMLVPIESLCRELEKVSDQLFPVESKPTDEEIRRAFERVSLPLKQLLGVHETLWKRPFPPGLEAGQALLSEIIQRPLRDLLAMLERVIQGIDDPDATVDADGGLTICFHLNLEVDRELQAFGRWCRDVAARPGPRKRPTIPRTSRRQAPGVRRESGFGKMVAAFLFGWWWGSR